MKKLAPAADHSRLPGGAWPTASQQLLLRAALLGAPAGPNAWAQWQETVQTDAIDISSWLLIPLVYSNLRKLGVDDPLLAQAKDCHLYYWCCNQKLFHLAAGFLGELQRLNIKALVLKGAVLANLYYPDIGCRPMADLDLLIPSEEFVPLGRRLLQEGWTETDGHSFALFRMDRMPSFGFMRPDGFRVDLHCHVLHADCSARADDEFWSHARPWALKESSAWMLAPEDQLLHVVSHGVRWCDAPHFRWIADAWCILAHSRGGFDWDRLFEQARVHEITLPLLRGLECMQRITPSDIPPDFLTRLAALPVPARALVRFTVATHPLPRSFFPKARGLWKALGEEERARPLARRNIRRTLSLLLFGGAVVIRDRRQIFSEISSWMRRLPVKS